MLTSEIMGKGVVSLQFQPIKEFLIFLVFIAATNNIAAQTAIDNSSWKSVATGMPDEWYGSGESKAVAANVLLYQRDAGGWPKNIPFHKPLNDVEKATISDEKGNNDATFDNSATTTEMKFLARMFNATNNKAYKESFNLGLKFIFDAQYDNGGWPMFYPPRKGYYTHLTYNDNTIINNLEILRDIYNKKQLYGFIATDEIVTKAKTAFDKGIECILRTQIINKGRPTVWCAQHDEYTFLPAAARSYELPSFSGAESVGIVNLLMEIPSPSPEIIRSVQGAIEWFDSHRIKNTRLESFTNKDGLKDRRVIFDVNAGDMWARFYDLETEEPFVCDRDGIKKKSMEEIGYERRNGYSWYTTEPQKVLDKYPEWKAKRVK
jgi:PelA/Pel-15E family pectate lyase